MHFPPSKTNAHSSFREAARTMSPGCNRRTDILIHSHPACSRSRCNSSPDCSAANSREWTREGGSLTSPPNQRISRQGSNRFETIQIPFILSNLAGKQYGDSFLVIFYERSVKNIYSTRLYNVALDAGRASDRRESISSSGRAARIS